MIWVLSHTWIRWYTDSISKKKIVLTIVVINCYFKECWNRINVNIHLTISKAEIYILTVICSPLFYLYLPLAFNRYCVITISIAQHHHWIISWWRNLSNFTLYDSENQIYYPWPATITYYHSKEGDCLDNSCSTRLLGQCDTIYLLNLFH